MGGEGGTCEEAAGCSAERCDKYNCCSQAGYGHYHFCMYNCCNQTGYGHDHLCMNDAPESQRCGSDPLAKPRTENVYLQLRPLLPPRLAILIPQHAPQDLPTRALRDDIDELDTALPQIISEIIHEYWSSDMLLHAPDRHTVVFFQPHRRRLDNVGFR